MSLSRPRKDENQPQEKYYIGRDKPNVEYSTVTEMHWYQAYLMGYRAKAWPKRDNDCDDIRYDLVEKENFKEKG